MAHAFGAEPRAQCTGGWQGPAFQVTVEEAGRPGIARAGGIDHLRSGHGGDAVQVGAAGEPSAVLAHFDGGDAAEIRQTAGESGIFRGEAREEGVNLVLVGEDHVDPLVQLFEDPVAGGVDDLEGGQVYAEGYNRPRGRR